MENNKRGCLTSLFSRPFFVAILRKNKAFMLNFSAKAFVISLIFSKFELSIKQLTIKT